MVDVLRSCYSRPCRFYRDQTIPTRIVWFFADAGALPLGKGTVFWPYSQVKDVANVHDGIGEDTSAPIRWRNGSKPWPTLTGTHSEGTIDDYLGRSNAPLSARGEEPQLSDRPECADHTALVLTGGTAWPTGGGDIDGVSCERVETASTAGDVDGIPVPIVGAAIAGDVDSTPILPVILEVYFADLDSTPSLARSGDAVCSDVDGNGEVWVYAGGSDVDGATADKHYQGAEQYSDRDGAGDAVESVSCGDVDSAGESIIDARAGDLSSAGDDLLYAVSSDLDSAPHEVSRNSICGDRDSSTNSESHTIAGDVDSAGESLPLTVFGDVDSALEHLVVPAIAGDRDSATSPGPTFCLCCGHLVSPFLRLEVFDCVGAYIGLEGVYLLEFFRRQILPVCGEYRAELPFGHVATICGQDVPSGIPHAFMRVSDDAGGDQTRSSSTYTDIVGTYARFGSAGATVPLTFGIGACSIRVTDPLFP